MFLGFLNGSARKFPKGLGTQSETFPKTREPSLSGLVAGDFAICGHPTPLTFCKTQKNSRRLWRSQRRNSNSVPEGGPIFQQPFLLPENAQTLAGMAFRAARKSGEELSSSVEICRKTCAARNFGQPQPSRVFCKTRISLAGFGNRFWHPKEGFPPWISSAEKDGHFWVSETEGCKLALRLVAGCSIFTFLLVLRQGSGSWTLIAGWQVSGGIAGLVAQAVLNQVCCMTRAVLGSIAFLGPLLAGNIYQCSGSLTLASACLRESAAVHLIVILFWGSFCLQSNINTMKRKGTAIDIASRVPSPRLLTKVFCFLAWLQLALFLSVLAILDQACKSVPGFLQVESVVLKSISTCIGACQSLIIKFLIPKLSVQLFPGFWFLEGLACLLVGCLVPALVIVYLDGTCLGHWTAYWAPCSWEQAAQLGP